MSRITSSSSGGLVTVRPTSSVLLYNEITSVVASLESDILVYTVSAASSLLVSASVSGGNIGLVVIYKNSDVIDKQYLHYTQFNLAFDFSNTPLANGDVITITGLNQGNGLCDFNARLQVIETT